MDSKEIDALIALLDSDRDGRVSLTEWTAMFHLSAEDELANSASSLLGGGSLISAADLPRLEEILEEGSMDEGSEEEEESGEEGSLLSEDDAVWMDGGARGEGGGGVGGGGVGGGGVGGLGGGRLVDEEGSYHVDEYGCLCETSSEAMEGRDASSLGSSAASGAFPIRTPGARGVGGFARGGQGLPSSRRPTSVPVLPLDSGMPSAGTSAAPTSLGSGRRRASTRHSVAGVGGSVGLIGGSGPPSSRRAGSVLASTREEGVGTGAGGEGGLAGGLAGGAMAGGEGSEAKRRRKAAALAARVPRTALAEVVLRLEEQPRLVEMWTSHNTMANLKVSLWAPGKGCDEPDWVRPCKQRFCVGHYGHAGSYKPPTVTPLLPELEDSAVFLPFRRGDAIDAAFERVAPHPRSFRRAWQVHLPAPQPSFYVWQPVPSSEEFVALGMVITRTDEPPESSAVRCLHRKLCCPARSKPQFLWNDRGTMSGTAGSLWVVNNLQCIWATTSYEVPRGSAEKGAFWEIAEWPIRLDTILPPESPHADRIGKPGGDGTQGVIEDEDAGRAVAPSASLGGGERTGRARPGGGNRRRAQSVAVTKPAQRDSFGGVSTSAPSSPSTATEVEAPGASDAKKCAS